MIRIYTEPAGEINEDILEGDLPEKWKDYPKFRELVERIREWEGWR